MYAVMVTDKRVNQRSLNAEVFDELADASEFADFKREQGFAAQVCRLEAVDQMSNPEQMHTDAEIDEAVAEVKDEILDDIRRRTYGMPASVSSFSELHDYVDANEYGGFTDDERRGDWSLGDIIAMQEKVDTWLKAGRPDDEGAKT